MRSHLPARSWLGALRRYIAVSAATNLAWEFAQMPLYTLWQTGTTREIAFAALHCTGGDIVIATLSLVLALALAGSPRWPDEAHVRVVVLTLACGLAYTAFSEWLNIEIRRSWAYRDIMPVLPVLGTGLSPLAQWIVVPLAALWWAQAGASAAPLTR
jgi:hypothetical protein